MQGERAIQATIVVFDTLSQLSGFLESFKDLCSRQAISSLLTMANFIHLPWLFSSGLVVCFTLKGGWAYLQDLSILSEELTGRQH